MIEFPLNESDIHSHAKNMPAPNWVGVIPAAGAGQRLGLGAYPKEMIPVHYQCKPDGSIEPVLAIEAQLIRLAASGCGVVIVMVNDRKLELLRILGDGSRFNCRIVFAVQPGADGLWDAVARGIAPFPNANILLALPDTLFEPDDALSTLRQRMDDTAADLALGVFPTDSPETQAPVETDGNSVSAIWEKPIPAPRRNTWGIAAWGPKFSASLPRFRARIDQPDPSITLAFSAAIADGMQVTAMHFSDGKYIDLGTPAGLAQAFDPLTGRPRPFGQGDTKRADRINRQIS